MSRKSKAQSARLMADLTAHLADLRSVITEMTTILDANATEPEGDEPHEPRGQ